MQAMGQTATEIVSALEDTNPTFNTCMPMTSLYEPGFVLVFRTGVGTMTAFGKDDVLHAQVVSQLLVRFGVETAITTGLLRRLVEGFEMGFQTGLPLLFIGRIAVQDAVVAHQAPFDLVDPDLVSILYRTRFLAATDNPLWG